IRRDGLIGARTELSRGPGRTLDVVPAAVIVFLPGAALVAVDVAVVPGEECRTRSRARRSIDYARRLRPLIATLHGRGSPAAEDIRAWTRLHGNTDRRNPGFACATRASRTPGDGAASIRSSRRVIASGVSGASVRTVGDACTRVRTIPRVVRRAVSVARI